MDSIILRHTHFETVLSLFMVHQRNPEAALDPPSPKTASRTLKSSPKKRKVPEAVTKENIEDIHFPPFSLSHI